MTDSKHQPEQPANTLFKPVLHVLLLVLQILQRVHGQLQVSFQLAFGPFQFRPCFLLQLQRTFNL